MVRARAQAAGTDGAPAIILVEPQLGANIGAVARAMLNCGLTDLRLVRPRQGWDEDGARANSAGAVRVIEQARVFERLEEAIADLRHLYATTARSRDMVKPVVTPEAAAAALARAGGAGEAAGVLFGRERSGLTNDEVALADAAVTFPLNPEFTSLNLAQAVLLMAWEWRKCHLAATGHDPAAVEPPPASRGDVLLLFEHLEGELDAARFFASAEKRPTMVRNLRNLLERARLTDQDVRSLHGIVRALTGHRQRGA